MVSVLSFDESACKAAGVKQNNKRIFIMNTVKKVMVALVFTDDTKGMFEYAENIACSTGAELIVASVINIRDVQAVERIVSLGYEVDGDHYIDGVVEEREKILEKLIDESSLPKDRVKVVFKLGDPAIEILKLINSESVDMIIMGTQGHTNVEHVFIGSVAEKVFRKSPATVVSYRGAEHARKAKKRFKF